MSADAMKLDLDAALMELPCGIGKAIRYVKTAPEMERILRDVAQYPDLLPEEIIEPVKAVLDVLDGGDGAIYRSLPVSASPEETKP